MKHSTGKIDIIVDWVYEPNFRCSLRFFTQQQIKYCSSISLSLYQNAYQPKQFFWLTIEKSELSLKILWPVSIHSKLPFKRSGGVKQYNVGALKVCRKVAFEANLFEKPRNSSKFACVTFAQYCIMNKLKLRKCFQQIKFIPSRQTFGKQEWTPMFWNSWKENPCVPLSMSNLNRVRLANRYATRVCGDAVLHYFCCGFAVIFILTRSIAVSKH